MAIGRSSFGVARRDHHLRGLYTTITKDDLKPLAKLECFNLHARTAARLMSCGQLIGNFNEFESHTGRV